MKLHILGTGNATVTEVYNTCFLLEENGEGFLIDGGGGNEILRKLKQIQMPLNHIHHIFLTHKHIDHFVGIIWLVRMICQKIERGEMEGEFFLYGHDEVIGLVDDICRKLIDGKAIKHLNKELHLVVVEDGTSQNILNHEVTFFDIDSKKAKQFGFTMMLENDRKLSCCGDEPYNPVNEKYVQNSDWLLHEAFCLYEDKEVFKPYEKAHSTVKDACEFATMLGVKNLVLYHTEDKTIATRKKRYTEEGKRFFYNNLLVPDDMETYNL